MLAEAPFNRNYIRPGTQHCVGTEFEEDNADGDEELALALIRNRLYGPPSSPPAIPPLLRSIFTAVPPNKVIWDEIARKVVRVDIVCVAQGAPHEGSP